MLRIFLNKKIQPHLNILAFPKAVRSKRSTVALSNKHSATGVFLSVRRINRNKNEKNC